MWLLKLVEFLAWGAVVGLVLAFLVVIVGILALVVGFLASLT